MAKLDETDLEILAHLDFNARTPASKIARRIGLSNNAVHSRINELEETGIIKGYCALIDIPGLGYLGYRLYLQLQYINSAIEKEIFDYLKNSPYTSWCSGISGRFDICSIFWVRTTAQLEGQLDDLKRSYEQYIKEFIVVPYFGFEQHNLPFTKRIIEEKKSMSIGSGRIAGINQTDRKIIQMLSFDARMPLSKIAKKLGLASPSVKYRIDRLVENKVIAGMSPIIDMEKLGYTHCKIDLNLRSRKRLETIEQHVSNNESVDCLTRTASQADLEIGMYVKNLKELHEVLGRIQDEFSDEIQYFELYTRSRLVKDLPIPPF